MKKSILISLFSIILLLSLAAAAEENEEGQRAIHFMLGSITTIFGIVALFWTYSARRKLAIGSSLRQYNSNFLLALLFIVAASFWHLLTEVTFIGTSLGEVSEYPEYFLYIMAFLVFVLSAYQMKFISQEFSFEDQVGEMKTALDMKQKKKKK